MRRIIPARMDLSCLVVRDETPFVTPSRANCAKLLAQVCSHRCSSACFGRAHEQLEAMSMKNPHGPALLAGLDLNLLHVFHVVYRERSVSQAASILSVSQSAESCARSASPQAGRAALRAAGAWTRSDVHGRPTRARGECRTDGPRGRARRAARLRPTERSR